MPVTLNEQQTLMQFNASGAYSLISQDAVVLAGKFLIGLACTIATLACLRIRLLYSVSRPTFTRIALGLLVTSRMGVFVSLMIVLGFQAQSDVTVYYSEARRTLQGQVPFHDFFTPYSPLFPYLAAIPIRFWNSAKAIILESLIAEIISIPLWVAFARSSFDERVVRRAAVLYCLNPFAGLIIPVAGQNHIWLSLFLAASLCATLKRQSAGTELTSGSIFALGTVLIKWLALLHAGVLVAHSSRRMIWLTGMVLPIVVLYGAWMYSFGPDVLLGNITFHSLDVTSGNVPFYLTAFGLDLRNPVVMWVVNAVGLLALAAALLVLAIRLRHFDNRQTTFMLLVITFVFLLVSKKAYTSYFAMALFPFCLMMAETDLGTAGLIGLLTFLLLMGLEPSLWFRWLDQMTFSETFSSGSPKRMQGLLFMGVETFLLGGYVYYARLALRATFTDGGLTSMSGRSPPS